MKTQRAAVIGHPIGHTMSPLIQKRLFALGGIPLEYEVLDLPDLEAGLPRLRELDCFNVTIPYKSAILPFLDEVDPQAARFGSVNTVKVEGGRLTGYTTDGAGCRKALENHGLDFSGRVLLLGNGGAARALAFEIAQERKDPDLTIACRKNSQPKAVALGEELAAFLRQRGDRDFRIEIQTYEELEGLCGCGVGGALVLCFFPKRERGLCGAGSTEGHLPLEAGGRLVGRGETRPVRRRAALRRAALRRAARRRAA